MPIGDWEWGYYFRVMVLGLVVHKSWISLSLAILYFYYLISVPQGTCSIAMTTTSLLGDSYAPTKDIGSITLIDAANQGKTSVASH